MDGNIPEAESKIFARRNLTKEQLARVDLVPTCMTFEQFRYWRPDWRDLAPQHPLDGVCEDCTPEYKAQHMAAKKCSWPDVEFQEKRNEFGTVVWFGGVRKSLRKDDPA